MSRNGETGSAMMFMVAFVLPLCVFSAAISLDLMKYSLDRKAAQTAVDEAAMAAYRHLPYVSDASLAARSYVTAHYRNLDIEKLSINGSGQSIEVLYSGATSLFFGRLFNLLSHGPSVPSVSFAVSAEARATPFDSLILMDASAALAPGIGESPWPDVDPLTGNQRLPARFFANTYVPWSIGAGIATQQCFNPSFSPLKRTVLDVYTYLSNFSLDQIGVGVFPGYGEPISLYREVQSGFKPGSGEANFVDYSGVVNADVLCGAAAERETLDATYQFPPSSRSLKAYAPTGVPTQLVLPATYNSEAGRYGRDWQYNQQYNSYLSVNKALWSSAVREGPQPDFSELISWGTSYVLGAPVLAARSNQKGKVGRYLVIFSGDLPWINARRWSGSDVTQSSALISRLQSLNSSLESQLSGYDASVKVLYVLFDHQGSNGVIAANYPALTSLLADALPADSKPRVQIVPYYVSTAAGLREALGPLLLLGRRSVVLSR